MIALRPSLCELFVRSFGGVAGGVAVFDGAEVEFFQAGFDFGAIAYGYKDELVGMDVGLGGFGYFGGGDGFKAAGEFGVVVEREAVDEDLLQSADGGLGGFEVAGEGVEQGVFRQLELGG